MDENALKAWCLQELSKIQQTQVDEEYVSYLLSLESKSDVKDFVCAAAGDKNSKTFLRELYVRWQPGGGGRGQRLLAGSEQLTELVRTNKDDLVLFAQKGVKSEEKKGTGMAGHAHPPSHSSNQVQVPMTPPPGLISKPSAPPGMEQMTKPKARTKFVPLLNTEGQSRIHTINIPGRHACQCLGQKHQLVNNCLECGRIVCSQEGPGPCLFCGMVVLSREDEEVISRDSRKAQKIREKLLQQYQVKDFGRQMPGSRESSKSYAQAKEHKDKLLEFDQLSVRRTKVIDDESDYFSLGSQWLSESEREALQAREESLRERKQASRRNKKITLDFAGRRVIEEEEGHEVYSEESVRDILDSRKDCDRYFACEVAEESICNPLIPIAPPILVDSVPLHKKAIQKRGKGTVPLARVQDRELMEMKDEGQCLSMHQPWASLLVCGIKKYEGRTWYTTHRGKLWIAAATKKPEPEDIRQIERFYTSLYGGTNLPFPSSYPTGCLLGCVDLLDCISQEDFRENFPEGESESPYVFICENPRQLLVKFPIKGEHKIWKLPSNVHNAAKRSCKAVEPLVLKRV